MSISGSLEDVSVADVMQFIHLGRRTGTLVLSYSGQRARIGFHAGRLVSAHAPERPKLGDLLISKGLIEASALQAGIDLQQGEAQGKSLGRILVDRGDVDPEALRQVIVQQIESNVAELVTWDRGTFEFVVDDLRPVDDIALFPGDVVPDANINTQMVLLEAARIFDERNRDQAQSQATPRHRDPDETQDARIPSQPSATEAAATLLDLQAVEEALGPIEPQKVDVDFKGLWLDIVSDDGAFAQSLVEHLPKAGVRARQVELSSAGVVPPGSYVPITLVDLRPNLITAEEIRRQHLTNPHVPLVALVDAGTPVAPVYEAGVLATVPAEIGAVMACLESVFDNRRDHNRPTTSGKGVARLRRVYGDLRSGLISATVALNLMHIISESVERAVLFLVKRDEMTALGAFGAGESGRPLAELTRNLRISFDTDSSLVDTLDEGEAKSFEFEEARLPARFASLVGRPKTGQVVIFPVLGAQRVIAIIYTDNGEREDPIEDIEILELATAQVGMAFENELLRRQLSEQEDLGE